MADNFTIQGDGLLVITVEQSAEETHKTHKRAFVQSQNINVFPCSRRGQFGIETVDAEGKPITVKANGDPEARLNTERTNRLRTSINGFTDSFIGSFTKNKDENGNELETGTLIFALAGYRMEVKEFNPANIATALGIDDGIIYAHLSLHDGIPFGVANYYTELLYRQSNNAVNNYIDVEYSDDNGRTKDFFMGVSFTSHEAVDTIVVNDKPKLLKKANLPLFSKSGNTWKLVEASKLPKVAHGTEPDSIKLGPAVMSSLIVGEKADSDTFLDGTIKAKNNILAEKDITAEQDLIAKRDIKVTKKATVESLVVGERTNTDSTEAGVITAKNLVKTPTLNATTVDVDNITSDAADGLVVNPKTNINNTLKVTGKATLDNGLEVINGDTSLKKLSAKETNLDSLAIAGEAADGSILTVNGNTTITDNLEVFGTTSAPTLKVDTITSNSEEVVVDKIILKVNNKAIIEKATVATANITEADVEEATVTSTLNIHNDEGDAQLNADKAIITELEVAGDIQLQTVTVNGLTDNQSTQLSQLQVSGNATINGLTKANDIDAVKITANEIWLDDVDNIVIGQVPALEVAHFTGTNTYQLRFRFKTSPIIEDVPLPPSSDEVEPTKLILSDEDDAILTDSDELILTASID